MWSPVNGSPGFAGSPQIQQLVSSKRTCLLARSCAQPRRGTACSGQRPLPLGLPQTMHGLRRPFMVFRLSAVFRGFAARWRRTPAGRSRATCGSRSGNSLADDAPSGIAARGRHARPQRPLLSMPLKGPVGAPTGPSADELREPSRFASTRIEDATRTPSRPRLHGVDRAHAVRVGRIQEQGPTARRRELLRGRARPRFATAVVGRSAKSRSRLEPPRPHRSRRRARKPRPLWGASRFRCRPRPSPPFLQAGSGGC